MHGLLTTYLVTVRVRATVEHALDLAPIALRTAIALIKQLLVELGPLLRSQGCPRRCPRLRTVALCFGFVLEPREFGLRSRRFDTAAFCVPDGAFQRTDILLRHRFGERRCRRIFLALLLLFSALLFFDLLQLLAFQLKLLLYLFLQLI